jgi:hypothetical protein
MQTVGTKNEGADSYSLTNGKLINRAEIAQHTFVESDVGMSIEQVKVKLDALRNGTFQVSDERKSDCCWLMHEGGVGCTGCACDGRPVWEYCWDYQ